MAAAACIVDEKRPGDAQTPRGLTQEDAAPMYRQPTSDADRAAHRQIWKDAGIAYGLCLCGCGRKTNVARVTTRSKHQVRNQPVRYRHGHGHRLSGEDIVEDRKTGCWIWQLSLTSCGYGSMWENGRHISAHRWYYQQLVGPILKGRELDHLCCNPRCVNPGHLEVVTRTENRRRASKLNMSIAREIRASSESNNVLARRYSVTSGAIRNARMGKTWREVPEGRTYWGEWTDLGLPLAL